MARACGDVIWIVFFELADVVALILQVTKPTSTVVCTYACGLWFEQWYTAQFPILNPECLMWRTRGLLRETMLYLCRCLRMIQRKRTLYLWHSPISWRAQFTVSPVRHPRKCDDFRNGESCILSVRSKNPIRRGSVVPQTCDRLSSVEDGGPECGVPIAFAKGESPRALLNLFCLITFNKFYLSAWWLARIHKPYLACVLVVESCLQRSL